MKSLPFYHRGNTSSRATSTLVFAHNCCKHTILYTFTFPVQKTSGDTIASYSALAKSTGFGQLYQDSSLWWANWNNNFIEPIRDTFWRTPSYKIAELEKYSLFHYASARPTSVDITPAKTSNAVPLLIVYAFISRHYILDLVPEVSVVRNLLKQGFDIYATDWVHLLLMIKI